MSDKRERFASLLEDKLRDRVPESDSVIASIMESKKIVKEETQLSVNTEIQFTDLGRKNTINKRGKIKKTFEMTPEIEKRLRNTANRYDATATELIHAILNLTLDK